MCKCMKAKEQLWISAYVANPLVNEHQESYSLPLHWITSVFYHTNLSFKFLKMLYFIIILMRVGILHLCMLYVCAPHGA